MEKLSTIETDMDMLVLSSSEDEDETQISTTEEVKEVSSFDLSDKKKQTD